MGRKLNPTAKARLDASLASTYGDGRYARCSWCGIDLDLLHGAWQRDRVLPGGRYALDNVLPTCEGCNADRGDQTTGYWHERERLYGLATSATVVARDVTNRWLSDRREAAGRAAEERARRRARVRAERR